MRGVEGGVGDVGDGGEPVLRQVLPALGVGHPCQGEEHSQYEKIDHYDYIVIINIAMVTTPRQFFFIHPSYLFRESNILTVLLFFRLPPGAETHYKHSFIS